MLLSPLLGIWPFSMIPVDSLPCLLFSYLASLESGPGTKKCTIGGKQNYLEAQEKAPPGWPCWAEVPPSDFWGNGELFTVTLLDICFRVLYNDVVSTKELKLVHIQQWSVYLGGFVFKPKLPLPQLAGLAPFINRTDPAPLAVERPGPLEIQGFRWPLVESLICFSPRGNCRWALSWNSCSGKSSSGEMELILWILGV